MIILYVHAVGERPRSDYDTTTFMRSMQLKSKSKSTHSSPRSCSRNDRAFCEGWFCICEAEKGDVSGYADCRQRSVCKIQTSRMHGLFLCRSGYRQILLNALYVLQLYFIKIRITTHHLVAIRIIIH